MPNVSPLGNELNASDSYCSLGHGWTYSSYRLCTAASVANLDYLDQHDLVRNAGEVGPYLKQSLTEAVGDHPVVGEVRGEGMLAAVKFVRDRDDRGFFDVSEKVGIPFAAALLKRGVIGRAMPQGNILGFAPPLCLTREEADIIVAAVKGAVDEVGASL